MWQYDDGGRAAAGFRSEMGDCVCRAIAIATGIAYAEVYRRLAEIGRAEAPRARGKPSHPRTGVNRTCYEAMLVNLGATWTSTMAIGSGCRVHLRADELPGGRLIARLSKHLVAVIDGVTHDTYDCSREGMRCVYGYFTIPTGVSLPARGAPQQK